MAEIPDHLLKRSREAKARALGISIEEVIAMEGGAAPAPKPAPTTAAAAAAEPAPAAGVDAAEETVAEETVAPAAVEPAAAAEAPAPEPDPELEPVPEEEEALALAIDEIFAGAEIGVASASAGIATVTRFGRTPRWLLPLWTLVPLAGLLYFGVNLEVGCGEAGVVDTTATGELANCDGSPVSAVVSGGVANIEVSNPYDLTAGQAIYMSCAACHGVTGAGGVGPKMAEGEVIKTWPRCAQHVTWVQQGSASVAVGQPYGAQQHISKGGMPAFADTLTEIQLQAVVYYERVVFGGEVETDVQADCAFETSA